MNSSQNALRAVCVLLSDLVREDIFKLFSDQWQA